MNILGEIYAESLKQLKNDDDDDTVQTGTLSGLVAPRGLSL